MNFKSPWLSKLGALELAKQPFYSNHESLWYTFMLKLLPETNSPPQFTNEFPGHFCEQDELFVKSTRSFEPTQAIYESYL